MISTWLQVLSTLLQMVSDGKLDKPLQLKPKKVHQTLVTTMTTICHQVLSISLPTKVNGRLGSILLQLKSKKVHQTQVTTMTTICLQALSTSLPTKVDGRLDNKLLSTNRCS